VLELRFAFVGPQSPFVPFVVLATGTGDTNEADSIGERVPFAVARWTNALYGKGMFAT
jgi:hypothetical protein